MNQNIIRLANGEQYSVDHNKREGILRGRQRPIIELTATGTRDELAALRQAFSDPMNTEEMVLIYHGDEHGLTPEQLEGVAQDELFAYTVPGEFTEKEVQVKKETPDAPAEYGWQLTVQLGQRLYGEA